VHVTIARSIEQMFGGGLTFRVEAYDGSAVGPPDSKLTIRVMRPEAIARFVARPGELGLARAYVAGDLELEGDLDALFRLELPPVMALLRSMPASQLVSELGLAGLRPPPPPSIEARPRGAIHSRARDRAAVTHHYDVSNRFYELVLGRSMVYSCAVFAEPGDPLEVAQLRKLDLIARKLDLGPGMRLLDVGCGWGSMAIHAAHCYGCRVVGITLSEPQRSLAEERAKLAGVGDLVEFRVQDYRDVVDGPFDAISSIGMFEHVGRRSIEEYVAVLWRLLRPGGRLLNHAIGRPATTAADPTVSRRRELLHRTAVAAGMRGPSKIRSPFMERYVFPDGELHEVGSLVSMFQLQGFEVRDLESLREHYTLTLRRWVANLEARWDDAVDEVGIERARVWRLYMAGSAVGFERHHLEIHQLLFVRPAGGGSLMPLRVHFEPGLIEDWTSAGPDDGR
jgi:cyclopropane-fatty-acyl-phospholipid synthase